MGLGDGSPRNGRVVDLLGRHTDVGRVWQRLGVHVAVNVRAPAGQQRGRVNGDVGQQAPLVLDVCRDLLELPDPPLLCNLPSTPPIIGPSVSSF